MTPFKAPGNFLEIESNQRSVALFVQKLRYSKVRMSKEEWRKGAEKRFIQSPSRLNTNAQKDLPLLKCTKNGEESMSVTCLWNWQKKQTLFHDSAHFFRFFSLLQSFFSILGLLGIYWGAFGRPGCLVGAPYSPHEQLTLHSYPHPGSGATASSIGQICGFLGSAKTIAPKPKLMEDGARAKKKKSVEVFVSQHALTEMKYQKIYDHWKGI